MLRLVEERVSSADNSISPQLLTSITKPLMPDQRSWISFRTGGAPPLATYLAIGASYVLAAQLAFQLGPMHRMVASLWPPAGLALAVLLLFGIRWWPGLVLGAIAASLLKGAPLPVSVTISFGNALAAVFGVVALRRLGFCTSLHRIRDALLLIGVGAIAAPVLSATIATGALHLLVGAPAGDLPPLWLNWWSGDAVAIVLVTPLLLAWLQGSRPDLSRIRVLEIILLGIGLLAGSVAVREVPPGYEYAVFALVSWSAIRFGNRGGGLAPAIVAAVICWHTQHGDGPFTGAGTEGYWRLQLFLALLAGGSLVLTAMAVGQARVASALRASDLRFRRVFEHAGVGIGVVSLEGRILDSNYPLQAMLGYSRKELVGLPISAISHPDDARTSDSLLRELVAGQRSTYRLTKRYLRKDGSVFWGRLATTYIAANEDGPGCVIGLVEDISEQCAAIEALRGTSQTLQTLVDASPLAIYTLDGDGQVQSWNQAAEQMFGWPATEVIGHHLPLVPPEEMATFRQSLGKVLAGEPLSGYQVRRRRQDGHPVDLRICAAPMRRPDGTIDRVIALAEDVTERKSLGEQLRQAQKMEAIGQLTGGIAHDFNNILTIVITNAALIAPELPLDRGDLRAELEDLHRAALRGVELVRKLMAFSRRRPVEMKPLDLGQVISDVSRDLGRLIPASIQVAVQVESGAALTISGDMGAIEQMLFNLATNARDAMPEGGLLQLRVYRAWLDAEHCRTRGWGAAGEYVVLAVSDTGCGMSSSVRARIFEPFFTTKEVGKGTGLGMAMVYGLVSQHRGYADIHSEEGKGTTVRLYFPMITASIQQPFSLTEAAAIGGTERILVVDDEDGVRRSAVRVLSRFGYAVEEAIDAEKALAAVGTVPARFDLVLTDVVMPRMSGMALYRELRRRDSGARVLLMSGHTAEDMDALDDPELAVKFLHKPWSVTDLLRRVREVLDDGELKT
jgi:two-component system cell cycle sensor histidine kinase/response regulator CckA